MKHPTKHEILGLLLCLLSLISFFTTSSFFDLFGKKITLDAPTTIIVPLVNTAFMSFSIGFIFGGIKEGVKWTARVVIILLLAFLLGWLKGNY